MKQNPVCFLFYKTEHLAMLMEQIREKSNIIIKIRKEKPNAIDQNVNRG